MDNITLFFLIFNLNGHFRILDSLMIFGADYLIYLTILCVLILGLAGKTREKKAFLLILLGVPIAILLIKGIHLFIFEPRPFVTFHLSSLVKEAADASFPSRHSTVISVIAFSVTYFKSKWAPLFLFIMLWVGLSRIFVGVHYPLDIAGGFAIGIISVVAALQVKKLLRVNFLK